MEFIDQKITDYAIANSSKQPELLDELMEYTKVHFPEGSVMLSGTLEGRFLYFLTAMTKAKRVLELGTFTGFSALSIAEALPDEGKVITCDADERVEKVVKQFAARSPYGHKIDFRLGNGLETLKTLTGTFDLVFIDADKMAYPDYFERSLERLSDDGLIVLDNTLYSLEVLNPETDKGHMFIALNKKLATDPRIETLLLPLRDGVTLVRKKSNQGVKR